MQSITILVTHTMKQGMRGAFLAELEKMGLRKLVLAEDGCGLYNFYLSAADEDELLLVEKWDSKKQQEAHLLTPHMKSFLEIKGNYVADTKLEVFPS